MAMFGVVFWQVVNVKGTKGSYTRTSSGLKMLYIAFFESKYIEEFAFFNPLQTSFGGLGHCALILFCHFLGKVVEDFCLLSLLVNEDAPKKLRVRQLLKDLKQDEADAIKDEEL